MAKCQSKKQVDHHFQFQLAQFENQYHNDQLKHMLQQVEEKLNSLRELLDGHDLQSYDSLKVLLQLPNRFH
jgi:conjugal transfer/entry exclusion protein